MWEVSSYEATEGDTMKQLTFEEQLRRARRAAVPILAVETSDQPATIATIKRVVNGDTVVMAWDIIRGLLPITETAGRIVNQICKGEDPALATGNPSEMLSRVAGVDKFAKRVVVIMQNAHNFVGVTPDVTQGVANLRTIFAIGGHTFIMLAPGFKLPGELTQDVMIVSDGLPDVEGIKRIITETCGEAEMEVPEDIEKLSDTLIGLSAFSAEQTLATCIYKRDDGVIDIDREALWERKCKAIEQSPGLSIWRGGERFGDIGGCDNAKRFIQNVLKGNDGPRAIVFIDEIEKSLAGASRDTSGVSQDQLGCILAYMQDYEVDGIILIGPPGAAKSAIAKAAGNEAGIPTIAFDLGAMKNALVGKSGEQTRGALRVIEAISQGRTLFIATCNSIGVLPPELRRRFTMGTFFFDLPDETERAAIWSIYMKKYGVGKKQEIPDDGGWTGAEIKQCAKLASKLGISLKEAAKFIVPVSVSAGEQIETLRSQASGKFISASVSGIYNKNQTIQEAKRNFDLN